MNTKRIAERQAPQTLFLLLLAVLAIGACDNSSFYTILGNKIQVPQLQLSPATATVPANASTTHVRRKVARFEGMPLTPTLPKIAVSPAKKAEPTA